MNADQTILCVNAVFDLRGPSCVTPTNISLQAFDALCINVFALMYSGFTLHAINQFEKP